MRIAIYAYPWDDVDRADLGADQVVVATSYHSVRAATPRHPRHRVLTAASGLYLPVDPSAWGRLVPAAREPIVEGLGERAAWVVLTHNSVIGRDHPDVCARNAFGDLYEYALCPSVPAVREYAANLVREIARAGATSMVLEACGPMGLGHLSAHEKTAGADWSAIDEALLSICFCEACTTALADAGLDVVHLQDAVRRAVGAGCASMEDALGPDAKVVLDVRRRATADLRDQVVAAARANGVRDIAMHASIDPWSTGPAAAVDSVIAGIDRFVIPAWELTGAGVERVAQFRRHRLRPARLAAYVTALPPVPARAEVLAAHWLSLVEAGVGELHVYHAGLASTARLDAIRTAIAIVRGATE
ncbi:hypothetical protein OG394_38545 [Kribbella sp. NBC_01245]|uniref:hypothetical protein n=1 Tax=Kribbella sp. NBC_01245 TaxID=2903578 RepID=UPI002E2B78F5|nr:hypothetical protein [Kribbella sp. NBC_01245]